MVNWGKIIFGGVDSSDYGIYISGEAVYNAPQRAVEFVDVPGRNGAIAIDQGRFNNITVTYPSGTFGKTQEEFREAVSNFRNAIMSLRGYQKLEDTYHPEEYRMAVYVSGLEVSPANYGHAGEFDITFECKPQRWLACGDYPIPVNSGQFMDNPTPFESNPILLSSGYGMINFNGFSIGLENQPMGLIELPSISIRRENTGAGISSLVDFSQCRLDTGDRIYMPKEFAWFRNTLYIIPSDSVTDLAYSSLSADLDASRTGVSYWAYPGETPYIEFQSAPLSDIEFAKGTTSYLEYTAVVTFNVGETAHSFTEKMTLYYDGDYEITISLWINQTSQGSLNLPLRLFEFSASKWFADSTFPTWQQDFEYVVIDCDLGEAYAVDSDGYVNLNKWVNFGSDLPTLGPGQNKITYDNTVTSLQIKPRWWKV